MKIIQTFWTKPIYDSFDKEDGRKKGGWIEEKYNYFSWGLSCLNLCKLYDEVELYTDKRGYDILVNQLKLPYTKVHCCLDDLLSGIPSQLWSVAKLVVYSLQETPFLHIDGDVFLWKKLPEWVETAGLVVQNFELGDSLECYRVAMSVMRKNCIDIPDVFIDKEKDETDDAVNAGVFGGTDTSFIQSYARYVLSYIKKNLDSFNFDEAAKLNVLLEQQIFLLLAKKNTRVIRPLFNHVSPDFSDVIEFHRIYTGTGFIHMLGDAKWNKHGCELVENHVRLSYPEYYKLISSKFVIKDKRVMGRDFDHSRKIAEKYISCCSPWRDIVRTVVCRIKEYEPNRVLFYKNIWKIEKTIYNIGNTSHIFSDERYSNFVNMDNFLKRNDFDSFLMNSRFSLTSGLDIFISKFSLESIESNIPDSCQKETVILIKNEVSGAVLESLGLTDSLIIYFRNEVLSGWQFYNILRKLLNTDINESSAREIAFSFLLKHSVFNGYLSIVNGN